MRCGMIVKIRVVAACGGADVRVLVNEACAVVDLVVDNNVKVLLGGVLRDVRVGELLGLRHGVGGVQRGLLGRVVKVRIGVDGECRDGECGESRRSRSSSGGCCGRDSV